MAKVAGQIHLSGEVRHEGRGHRAGQRRGDVAAGGVAGRVGGTIERPQLLPLQELTISLVRGSRDLGRLAIVRDVLPGRFAFGITGRGPTGRRLPPGDYALRVTAVPVGGARPSERDVPFSLR